MKNILLAMLLLLTSLIAARAQDAKNVESINLTGKYYTVGKQLPEEIIGIYKYEELGSSLLYSLIGQNTIGPMINLGTLGGDSSSANGVNDLGHVVGSSTFTPGNNQRRAFLYRDGQMINLGILGSHPSNHPTSINSYATSINNDGQVCGNSITSLLRPNGTPVIHAFTYINGAMQDIGTLSPGTNWDYSTCSDINDMGQMVGNSEFTASNGNQGGMRAFLYSGGSMVSLGLLPGCSDSQTSSFANAINNAGQIVGSTSKCLSPNTSTPRGFLYSDGVMTELAHPNNVPTYAYDINDSGQIVGHINSAGGGNERAFLLTNGVWTDLGPGIARGINNAGDVVGYSGSRSFLYRNGTRTDLGTLGGSTAIALRINDAGKVVGNSSIATGLLRAFIQSTSTGPIVTDVQRTYEGYFLSGYNGNNNFNVSIDWRGAPGQVRFQVNNNPPFEVPGNAAGVIHPFNLTTSFTPSYLPSLIKITPINAEGIVGETRIEKIYVFPHPTWLQTALAVNPQALTFTPTGNEIRKNFSVSFPNRPLDAVVLVPAWVPMVGGRFGIRNTQGVFNGYVSSLGSGSLGLGGQSTFTGFGIQENSGAEAKFLVTGNGGFLINEKGFLIPTASFNLSGDLVIQKDFGILQAFPILQPLTSFKPFKKFNSVAKINTRLKTSPEFNANWKQNSAGELVFDEATGKIDLQFQIGPKLEVGDSINFNAYVGGGGELMLGLPVDENRKFVRGLNLIFQTGAEIKFGNLIEFAYSKSYRCSLISSTTLPECFESNTLINGIETSVENYKPELRPITYPYTKYGSYEIFRQTKAAGHEKSSPDSVVPVNKSPIISNVFPGAEPTIIPIGNDKKLLVWVTQNPNLPVMQSTDISWSFFDGTNWSQPAVITSDTRAEFSPVIGVNADGKVVAAWLKVKDPNFNTPISVIEDLPLFYKQVEVVSSVFDPISRTWGSETVLTNDLAFDTSLRLVSDSTGKLLLTWQSNPSGEFIADVNNPSTLKYSFWGSSGWETPAVVAANLSNVSEHTVAGKSNSAFIVLSYDPNPDMNNDSKLILYRWNGTNWSQGNTFAEGAIDNLSPKAVYDTAGEGRIVWRRGANLVQATLTNSTPRIVREASESAAFGDFKLINNSRNELTLIWEEAADDSPGNIFAKIYNPATDTWKEDRRLNRENWQSQNANGYYDSENNLQLVYLSTEILLTSKTVIINGQTFEIPNVPQDGQTDIRFLKVKSPHAKFDFDGDSKSDVSVFRPADGSWWYLQSSDSLFKVYRFGVGTDKIVPGDYTGDGKSDIAVFRDGTWFIQRSEDNSFFSFPFGAAGDIPAPTDYDGDGKIDAAVYRPSLGTWYILNSNGTGTSILNFGTPDDKPVPADFDGDGKSDIAIFRPSDGSWWYLRSSDTQFRVFRFGVGTDKPVQGDYTGDGKADIAVFRPSTGEWFFQRSEDNSFYSFVWGTVADMPTPGDYDGDGKFDASVFRTSNNTWYMNQTTSGVGIVTFGSAGDQPVPNAFVP